MTTKAEVTEYVNEQFEVGEDSANVHYWFTQDNGIRAAFWQEWLSPEIASILKKLIGDATVISLISKNGSNK
jgi:hypothetical protein